MKWLKAAVVGAGASLVMFLLMTWGIQAGFAPFKLTPSMAFLERLGWNIGPLALIVHFGYGMVWSLVLVAIFDRYTNVWRGMGLALVLWLVMMLVYSPLIGWGVFGFNVADMASNEPLALGSPVQYIIATFVLHLIYGGLVGWLNPLWINFEQPSPGPESAIPGTG